MNYPSSSSSDFRNKAFEYMERPEFFQMCQSFCLWTLSEERLLAKKGILKGNLRRLVVCVDQAVKCNWEIFRNTTPEGRAATEARQESLLRVMVQFVEDHTTRFPGRPKTLGWSRTLYSPDPSLTCRERVELEMLRPLTPIMGPTTVTSDTLSHIWAHLPSTDLEYVRPIKDFRLPMSWIRVGGIQDCRPLLQCCRVLDSLHMATVGQGVFDWAVQETKDLGHGLVPLWRIEVMEIKKKPLTDELDDIGRAFSRTIETIKVFMTKLDDMPPRPVRCLRLRTVDLTDETFWYHCKGIVACMPGDLPCLESLRLFEWSALTFHPATLHFTQALKKLTLGIANLEIYSNIRYYIPSDKELIKSFDFQDKFTTQQGHAYPNLRPPWNWDWHLPSLEHLTLTAEFAYRFKFRMLHGCPSLVDLDLDYKRVDNLSIYRVLSDAELMLPIIDSDHRHLPGEARQAVVAPALQNVRLGGLWTICDYLLPQFFTIIIPNLKSFEGEDVNGITLDGLVDVVKSSPNKIKELRLSSSLAPVKDGRRRNRAGLVAFNGIPRGDV
ncbi:hypothetical protein BGX30_002233 [Mortierella sp. GBA39]|nr:hypothetical protein BGX30_002233 [Mortierella sp. GBA39]